MPDIIGQAFVVATRIDRWRAKNATAGWILLQGRIEYATYYVRTPLAHFVA